MHKFGSPDFQPFVLSVFLALLQTRKCLTDKKRSTVVELPKGNDLVMQ